MKKDKFERKAEKLTKDKAVSVLIAFRSALLTMKRQQRKLLSYNDRNSITVGRIETLKAIEGLLENTLIDILSNRDGNQ